MNFTQVSTPNLLVVGLLVLKKEHISEMKSPDELTGDFPTQLADVSISQNEKKTMSSVKTQGKKILYGNYIKPCTILIS